MANDTLLGFIPKNKYVLYTYYLLLAAALGGLVLSLLALAGIYLPLGLIFNLAGLAGLILALIGVFFLKPEFGALDQSHLVYLAVLIGVFFVIGLIVGGAFFASVGALVLLSLLVAAAQLLFVFTGFNSWKHGRAITKENLQSEVRLALKRA